MTLTLLTAAHLGFTTEPLAHTRIAVIGYGSQGEAQALNLKDSGLDVVVALREGSPSRLKAQGAGFEVLTPAQAAQHADLLALLIPDEQQPQLYAQELAPHLRPGQTLLFAHGLSIHFEYIVPPAEVDVVLLAPKGPGPMLRRAYQAGSGLAGIFAVHQDFTGRARETVLAYAGGLGCLRLGVLPTTFKEECETDLFGEQAVLCGGLSALIQAGFETLVEAGYQPEIAYFETVHEVKLIVDLIYERGIAGMNQKISNTAEFGGYLTGARLITAETRAQMRAVLAEIQTGQFARALMAEHAADFPTVQAERERLRASLIEAIGQQHRERLFLNK